MSPWAGPRSAVELLLLREWRDRFPLAAPDIHDDFFDLGGSSLAAVSLVRAIRRETGIDIPARALYEAPTPARLAAWIAQRERTDDGPVARLRGGAGLPLYLVHSAGGTAMAYVELARTLTGDSPVFGLEDLTEEWDGSRSSVETIAERHLRTIRALGATGSYAIGGWSFGALVAYEMARRVGAGRDGAVLLLMLDSPASNARRPPQVVDDASFWAWRFPEVLPGGVEELRGLSPPEQVEHLIDRWRAAGGGKVSELDRAEAHRQLEIDRCHVEAGWRYVLRPGLDVPFHLVTSAASVAEEGDAALGWRPYVPSVVLHPFGGDHHSLMGAPNVPAIAAVIDRLLEAAAARG